MVKKLDRRPNLPSHGCFHDAQESMIAKVLDYSHAKLYSSELDVLCLTSQFWANFFMEIATRILHVLGFMCEKPHV